MARDRPRFGYRRLHVLLGDEPAVNHKRVFRVYQEAGLAVKRRKRKRLVRVKVLEADDKGRLRLSMKAVLADQAAQAAAETTAPAL